MSVARWGHASPSTSWEEVPTSFRHRHRLAGRSPPSFHLLFGPRHRDNMINILILIIIIIITNILHLHPPHPPNNPHSPHPAHPPPVFFRKREIKKEKSMSSQWVVVVNPFLIWLFENEGTEEPCPHHHCEEEDREGRRPPGVEGCEEDNGWWWWWWCWWRWWW